MRKNMTKKTQRNDPCPCGSGEKYKKCCAKKLQEHKQKHFVSLKGKPSTSLAGSMKNIAGRVFKVLSETSHPQSSTSHDEELSSSSKSQGCRSLEELIGIEDPKQQSESSCCSGGSCCCHGEEEG